MATYNGAKYLKAQLKSFVDQTHQPDELIITDDCSSDETKTIVQEFAKTAPFKIEIHYNDKNLGYCGNFNEALIKTTGDLVFLSDQDDVWFPEKIEYMLGVARCNSEALVVMNDAVLTDDVLNEVGLTKIGQIRSAGFARDSFLMGCCCGVRRELLDLCMPIPANFNAHDNWLVWFADGLDAKLVDSKVLQYYRRHELNDSQIIVNRTTKLTRSKVFLHALKNTFHKDTESKLCKQVEQLKIFVDAIQCVERKAPEKYCKKLAYLKRRTIQSINTTESRMGVRAKWVFPRLVAVSKLLLNGGYRNTSGLKAVLRDIVG